MFLAQKCSAFSWESFAGDVFGQATKNAVEKLQKTYHSFTGLEELLDHSSHELSERLTHQSAEQLPQIDEDYEPQTTDEETDDEATTIVESGSFF